MQVKLAGHLETILFYLIVLFPLSAVTGPLFLDLFVSLSAILFILIARFDLFKIKYFKIFTLIYFLLIISSLFGENILISLKTSFPYLRFFIFVLAIIYISKKKNFFKLLHLLIFNLYLILVIDSYFQVLFGKTFFGIYQTNVRISGIFNDELVLGSFILKTIPIFISLAIYNMHLFNKAFNIFQFILIVLSLILIFFSGEKTTLLLSFFIFMSAAVYLKKKFFFSIIILCLFLFILNSTNIIDLKNVSTRYSFFKIEGKNISLNSDLFKDQFLHYKTAILIFNDNKLTGIGPRNFRTVCKNYDEGIGCSTHPHNFYLELLCETGIILFIIVLLIYFKFFKNYIISIYKIISKKNSKNLDKSKLFIITGIIINFFPFIQTGSIFNNWYAGLIFFSLAIYLRFCDEV